MRWLALVVVMALASACQCGRCDATTCAGCCTTAHECLPGDHTFACGLGGQACFTCDTETQGCFEGACGPAVVGVGSGAGSAGAGSAGAGPAGGGPVSGGAAPPPVLGGLTDVIGAPCSQFTDGQSAECSATTGLTLACRPVVGSTRLVCQPYCVGSTCSTTGLCVSTSTAAGTCSDCLLPCRSPTGLRENCQPNEHCVAFGAGARCVPDCRLQGAQCPGAQTCLPTGLCSLQGVVSRCRAY